MRAGKAEKAGILQQMFGRGNDQQQNTINLQTSFE